MASSLRGQIMRVPDWRPIFDKWDHAVNPMYRKLIPVVESTLERVVSDPIRLAKLKKSDFALFASSWVPEADWEVLKTIAVFCLWMFLFDDTIDAQIIPGVTNYASSYELASKYRRRTLDFIHFHLGLSVTGSGEPVCPHIVSTLFAEVALHFRKLLDKSQRKAFYGSLKYFIEATGPEQANRLSGELPRVADFYEWRLGTTAVDAMCDLACAFVRGNIPTEILRAEEPILRLEANKNTIFVNDILSLKKEIRDDTLMNLVVLTMAETGNNLESVINTLSGELIKCGQNFDASSHRMRAMAAEYGPSTQRDVEKLITEYQRIITAVWTWTCLTPRYGMAGYRCDDGSFLIPL
ncbi:hypothetical protein PpBr36_01147 [Pyricularia pennisetigena]|uniref:hypothetical protein n=1 Tax=Pyricularia pennisetigena TaxID=1578925 RepID=UPI001153DF59|nr:hypothetical protein PpBr36_01147 [Pyricularia pennisetigena]TLS28226.1 hypothetical protein PpBr36_01147 [Pyricularia pennisetigena]